MNTLYTIARDNRIYKEDSGANKWLSKEFFHKEHILAQEGKSFGELYNSVLDALPSNQHGWMLFCSQSFVLAEPIHDILESLDTSALYGFLGYKSQKNLRYKISHNILGNILLPLASDLTGFYRCIQIGGVSSDFGVTLDAIGGGCLLMHTDLVRGHSLRFDTTLTSFFHIELFSQKAIKEGISCRLLPLECSLDAAFLPIQLTYTSKERNAEWQEIRNTALEKYPEYGKDQQLYKKICEDINIKACPFDEKAIEFPLRTIARAEDDIYHYTLGNVGENTSIFASSTLMKPEANVLDMGCAQGDLGLYFKKKLSISLWGMEYNKNSVYEAKRKGIYKEVFHVDLEQLSLSEYSRFQHFFDHVFLGDILEHLRDPLDLLQKCAFFLRPEGSIIVSLPNVSTAEVTTNLLQNRFEYRDCGVLDATHLRFFTAKSQAELFTKAGYLVSNSLACFQVPTAWLHQLRTDISPDFYKKLFEDKHFSVLQYVSELVLTDKDFAEVSEHNYAALFSAPERPAGMWEEAMSNFTFAVDLESRLNKGEPYPEPIKAVIKELVEKDDVMSALLFSRLFNEKWYQDTYFGVVSKKESGLEHYLFKGWKEGKKPSVFFDADVYAKSLPPEIGISEFCPLVHFLLHGIYHDLPYKKGSE